METLIASLEAHGYLILLAVGFAEYAGVPIASVPVIIAAGGLGSAAGLNPVLSAGAAALGGFAADTSWYLAGRWHGTRMVDAACGLTSNPNACVLSVQERVARLGPAYVLPSKFIPGAGNLVAPAAGLAEMAPRRFLASDAAALLLWAGAYTAVGRIFSGQIQSVVVLVERYQTWALAGAVLLVVGAAGLRTVRSRLHGRAHADHAGNHADPLSDGERSAPTGAPGSGGRSGSPPPTRNAGSRGPGSRRGPSASGPDA